MQQRFYRRGPLAGYRLSNRRTNAKYSLALSKLLDLDHFNELLNLARARHRNRPRTSQRSAILAQWRGFSDEGNKQAAKNGWRCAKTNEGQRALNSELPKLEQKRDELESAIQDARHQGRRMNGQRHEILRLCAMLLSQCDKMIMNTMVLCESGRMNNLSDPYQDAAGQPKRVLRHPRTSETGS